MQFPDSLASFQGCFLAMARSAARPLRACRIIQYWIVHSNHYSLNIGWGTHLRVATSLRPKCASSLNKPWQEMIKNGVNDEDTMREERGD